jgi:DHA2 family multidrug resistance protein
MNRILDMQAATLAINDVFWGFSLMFLVAMVVVWLAKPPFASGKPGG